MWRWLASIALWITGIAAGLLPVITVLSFIPGSETSMTMIGGKAGKALFAAFFVGIWTLAAWRISRRHIGQAKRVHWAGCLSGLGIGMAIGAVPILAIVLKTTSRS